jgi:hypothetical protein
MMRLGTSRSIRRTRWIRVIVVTFVAACTPEGREPPATPAKAGPSWAILVPDWQNDVVHRIAADGTYEGDFLARDADKTAGLSPRTWQSPRALLYLAGSAGSPGSFWLAAERGLSVRDTAGEHLRSITTDTTHLQDPVAMLRVRDEVFVLSEDKKKFLVFGLDGVQRRTFGFPELDRATDCKVGPDGLLYVTSSLKHSEQPGLISVWDPKNTEEDARPIRHLIAPEIGDGGTVSLQSLAFDDDGNLLVTDLFRGRVERWSVQTNTKLDVLMDAGKPGALKELERGPDGLVYLAGPAGIYRFGPSAKPEDLVGVEPFFDAAQLSGKLANSFSPQAITFVPTSILAAPRNGR